MLGAGISTACQKALEVPASQRQISLRDRDAYTSEKQAIAHKVVDLIIPRTDTPGALDAGVPEFIDYVVTEWFTQGERTNFLRGLDELAAVDFLSRRIPAQIAHLNLMEQRERASTRGDGFIAQIKELTVVGFYTSQIGATIERAYLPMPGRYDGHHKFADVGKQWAS